MQAYAEEKTEAKVRADLVGKLWALALGSSAMEGESENSAVKMVRIARRDSVLLLDLLNHLAIMPASRIGTIARRFPASIAWMSTILTDALLREAAGIVPEWRQSKGTT